MNKEQLVNKIAEKNDIAKADAMIAVNNVLDAISEALAEEGTVRLIGFGTFAVKERKERKGRNPQTGEEIIIPAHKAIVFKAGKALKEKIE